MSFNFICFHSVLHDVIIAEYNLLKHILMNEAI